MKRIAMIAMMVLGTAGFAAAQGPGYNPGTDVLGAHLMYGRGCAACHAPHSGAFGNGANKSGDQTTGNNILWGEDVGGLYGASLQFGQVAGSVNSNVAGTGTNGPATLTTYAETLPGSLTAGTPDVTGLLTCLSCHDGNIAEGAMMKNKVYETLPLTYGTNGNIPTLLGQDGTGGGNYLNDHPVGLNAKMSCTGSYNWDCTITSATNGTVTVAMTGKNSAKFIANYGFFVSPASWNGQPVVMCTTCHNQHLMNVVSVTNGPNSGLATGTYATMFFLRGPYNPASTTSGSNQTAQFCRQCHGGESNEANGSTAGTIF